MRQDLLFSKKSSDTPKSVTRVITTYNKQHKAIKQILQKHWHLLQIDPTLSPHISASPTITFRRARSLKDHLVKSEYVGTFRSDPCRRFSNFTCGGCTCCQYMNAHLNSSYQTAKCKTQDTMHIAKCLGSFIY